MQKYPVGGPREPVYALMRELGFKESHWSDKFWRMGGVEVSIYGAGSMAHISVDGVHNCDCALDDLGARLSTLRTAQASQEQP